VSIRRETALVICGRRFRLRLRLRRDREKGRPRRRRWRGRSSSSSWQRLGLGRWRRTDRQDPDSLRRCLGDYSLDSADDDVSSSCKQPKTTRRPSLHHPSNTPGTGNTCGPVSTRLDCGHIAVQSTERPTVDGAQRSVLPAMSP